jgi:galactose mutarotase-like enzyme
MTVFLESEQLSICIEELGAELSSVKNQSGLEFLWQADKEIWPRHAPVLFPIVGKLKDDCFSFNDQFYTLTQHGFARDKNFKLIQHSDSDCIFELRSDAETKKNYPFDFIFQIHYQLSHQTLRTEYKVINPSSETIYFSVGAHPGFNCPLSNEESFEDYYLEFESSSYALTELNSGLRKETKHTLELDQHKLPLSLELFEKDALVFENYQINNLVLASNKSNHRITLQSENWPYFGIWTKKGVQKFICLEPWQGIADKENSSQNFVRKEGIIKLEAKKEFRCSFLITFK